MPKLLIVYHSMSGNTEQMAKAIAEEVCAVGGTAVQIKKGLEATIDDLLECDGVALGSPDYFSDMAGAIKDFFDRTYYPVQGKVTGKPCVIFDSAGGPPLVVIESLRTMAKRFELDEIAEPVGASGASSEEILEQCRQLGRKLAARLKTMQEKKGRAI